MKSFKQFCNDGENNRYEWLLIEVDEFIVHIMFETEDEYEINEAKHKGIPLGGTYSAQIHSAHSSVGQQHIHVYSKNNQLFSLNKDSTAHDQSHGATIPNKVAKAIKQRFPGFTLPKNNIIESANKTVLLAFKTQLLNEAM